MIELAARYWYILVIAGMLVAIGVQSYRLQGAQSEVQLLAEEKRGREERDALRELQNLKNRERTNEEYLASTKRASNSRVRVEGPGIRPRETVESAGSGNDPIACFDRGKLNEELAGLYERAAKRLTGIAQSGEGVAAAFRACQAWAVGLN